MAFLFEEQVEFFRTNGYLMIHQLISPEMIRELWGNRRFLWLDAMRESTSATKISELQNIWKTKPGFAIMSPY